LGELPDELGVLERVGNVDDRAVLDRPRDRQLAAEGSREIVPERLLALRIQIEPRHAMDELSVEADHITLNATAQSHRMLGDGIEHRLQICLRPADDAEYLGRCRLILCASALSLIASARG